MLLAIATEPADSNPTATVGGDVSRYQRRTVPPRPQTAAAPQGAPAQVAMATARAPRAEASLAAPRPSGPVVRIARGNNVTEVPVGAK